MIGHRSSPLRHPPPGRRLDRERGEGLPLPPCCGCGCTGQHLLFVLDTTPLDDRACLVYLGLLAHLRLLPVGWRVMPLHAFWETDQWTVVGALRGSRHPGIGPRRLYAHRGSWPGPTRLGLALPGTRLALSLATPARVVLCARARPVRGLLGITCPSGCGPGQSWFGRARDGPQHPCSPWLSAIWEPEAAAPWFLILDQPAGCARLQDYRRRMRVEATFLDFKSRGWDIEGIVLANPARVERLLLVLCPAVWWISHRAAGCIHRGARAF